MSEFEEDFVRASELSPELRTHYHDQLFVDQHFPPTPFEVPQKDGCRAVYLVTLHWPQVGRIIGGSSCDNAYTTLEAAQAAMRALMVKYAFVSSGGENRSLTGAITKATLDEEIGE